MSWDQEYSVPSINELLEKLTGKNSYDLLQQELVRQGTMILKVEEVLLDEGHYTGVKGFKVTFDDGRVYIPKLTEKFTENGNHGIDVYEYVLETETPEIHYTNVDDSNVFGETDEASLESDGELTESDLREEGY